MWRKIYNTCSTTRAPCSTGNHRKSGRCAFLLDVVVSGWGAATAQIATGEEVATAADAMAQAAACRAAEAAQAAEGGG